MNAYHWLVNRVLQFICVSTCWAAILAAVWIVVPAPSEFFWYLAVAAGEWGLWLGIAAVIGIVSGIVSILSFGLGRFTLVSIIAGLAAIIISLWPLVSVLPIARENSVSLSLSQYFAGIGARNKASAGNQFSSYTFARNDGVDLKLDVYRPSIPSENNGASVIVVHGGAWSHGVRNDFPQWNAWLARKGFTVFDVDYRLAPQPNYLTATGDIKCAVQWVKDHADEFGIDPDRVALLGRSAGAHLALLAAYSAGDNRLPSACPESRSNESVRAVISLYAPIDLLWAYDNPANQRVIDGPGTLANFLGGDPHESNEIRDRFLLASPTTHVSATTPPTLLIQGDSDQLVRPENMQILSEKLKNAGITNKTILIPYAQHGFDYNFNGWGSQITESVLLDFLSKYTSALE